MIGLVLAKYNLIDFFNQNAQTDFLKNQVAGLKRLTFTTFLLRVICMVKPKSFKFVWSLINDQSVLINVSGKIRPHSHEFRAILMKELGQYSEAIKEKIHYLLDIQSESSVSD